MGFRCPLCRTTVFEQLRADPAATSPTLYSCAGCSVVFTDPKRLADKSGAVPGQPRAAPSLARLHAPGKPPTGTPRGRRRPNSLRD
jgi:hypothetical protein